MHPGLDSEINDAGKECLGQERSRLQLEALDLGQIQTQPNYIPLAPEEPFWANYWLVLRKRKWVVGATLVIVAALATIVSLRTTPVYDASAKIEINRPNSDVLLGFKDVGAGYDSRLLGRSA